jgi:hypothetical protein
MKKLIFFTILFAFMYMTANSQPTSLEIKSPVANDKIRFGMTVTISWDTTGTAGQTFKFYWSESESGPWTVLPMPKGATEFVDGTAAKATGKVNTSFPNKPTVWLKMELKSDPTLFDVVGPLTIYTPAPSKVDSVITGTLTSNLHLSASKIYGLKGVVFVADGAVLSLDPGTIVFGEVGATSALVINRGGKIMAPGTAEKPIVFTSGVVAGQRDRGDWGGLLIMGKAPTNLGEAPIEGGIADDATKRINGWYGGNDPHDNSGVLTYVRIEFAGIAESPDNELNSLTLGSVGDGTTISHIMVSYAGDDAFEWFGGTVNAKYLIAYNTIDDDFDTDAGFNGKVQFGLCKRVKEIADISNSEAFESDNDSKSSEKQPFTSPVFSNFTVIGPVQDTTWTSGTGADKYHARYLTAAQIRRNSRMSLMNSVILGWPGGIELTNDNTVRAAGVDSLQIRNNSFFGIKNNKFFYFGSGTNPTANVDANWLSKAEFENEFVNGSGKVDALAKINDAFNMATFNPMPMQNATYLTTAKFDASVLNDPFFDKVNFRGAFGTERWDLPWANYDPVNTDYKVAGEKLTIKTPQPNDKIRFGMTVPISWDTTGTAGKTFKFYWSEAQTGPWTVMPMPKGATEFVDGTAAKAIGKVNSSFPNKPTVWLKMELKSDPTLFDVVGPLTIYTPAPSKVDSVITGTLTSNLHLSASKIYGLKGVVFVADGAVLSLDPGTIVFGEVGATSALVINRGGKIMAPGTAEKPIVFTSGVVAGQRDRGDWGGLLIMGKAPTNLGEAPIEGGIADDATKRINGWYGGNDPHDNSGVLTYVRIEFAGIAESPDNELNSLTLGSVGDGTTISHIMVSYAGDDAFEWFGGTVNAKYLIAYNTIDDDFDTDAGFNGKVQFGLCKRVKEIADISNSEAFESDNDSKSSEKQPFTSPVFSNFTVIGPVQDTTWTSGTGADKYHARYLTAAQIRRNSRMSLMNSVILGWPGGIELTNDNTVRAAGVDSLQIRNNSFFGIKNNKFFYFGSGTNPTANVDANWLSKAEFENEFVNGSGKVDALAKINDAFNMATFNPMPMQNATYLTTAKFDASVLNDPYFDKVNFRGAFGTERWDLPWANYDPVNTDYSTTSVIENANSIYSRIICTPNPMKTSTDIQFAIEKTSKVKIDVYNLLGVKLESLVNQEMSAGNYGVKWEAKEVPAGMYFIRMELPNKIITEKVVIE